MNFCYKIRREILSSKRKKNPWTSSKILPLWLDHLSRITDCEFQLHLSHKHPLYNSVLPLSSLVPSKLPPEFLWKKRKGKKHGTFRQNSLKTYTNKMCTSSARKSFHSEKLSLANDFSRDDIFSSIILSSLKARALNLYCWEAWSCLAFMWIFALIQCLADSLNIFSNSWFTTHNA